MGSVGTQRVKGLTSNPDKGIAKKKRKHSKIFMINFYQELEGIEEGLRREDLPVHVHREQVFEDSFRELFRCTPKEWKQRFYIVFEGGFIISFYFAFGGFCLTNLNCKHVRDYKGALNHSRLTTTNSFPLTPLFVWCPLTPLSFNPSFLFFLILALIQIQIVLPEIPWSLLFYQLSNYRQTFPEKFWWKWLWLGDLGHLRKKMGSQ